MGLCPPLPLKGVGGAGLVPKDRVTFVPTRFGQCHIIALEVQYLSRQFWRAAQLSEFATFEAPPEAFGSLLGIRSQPRSETFAFLGHKYTSPHSMS